MGPVVGALWHQEKEHGIDPGRGDLAEAELNTIGYVLSRYGALTGLDLEHLTHGEAPWQYANRNRRPRASARIEVEWMKEYFETSALSEDDDEEAIFDSAAVSEWLSDAVARGRDEIRPDSPADVQARLSRRA